MNDHKLEVAHPTVFVQRRVGAHEVDLARVCHLMDDLIKKKVYAVICFESKSKPDKEALLWNDRINRIFARIGCINRIDMQEPIHIGSFGSFLEDRINDV